jgi:hypothetical protein
MGQIKWVCRGIIPLSEKELIIYGDFDSIGNVPFNKIARWTPFGWQRALPGKNWQSIHAMEKDVRGNIIAAGECDTASPSCAGSVFALWDGTSWNDIALGNNGYVSTMTTDMAGNVIVGGSFSSVQGVAAKSIALWDGLTWRPLGEGVDTAVSIIQVDRLSNSVYTVCRMPNYVSMFKWDGIQWSSVSGFGLVDIAGMAIHRDGDLYIVGMEGGAGARPQTYRYFHGGTWSTIPSEFNFQEDANGLWIDSRGQLRTSGDVQCVKGVREWCNGATWDGSAWLRGTLPSGTDRVICTAAGLVFGLDDNGIIRQLDDTVWNCIGPTDSYMGYDAMCRDSVGNIILASDSTVFIWNGLTLKQFGSPLKRSIKFLEVNSRGELFAAGNANNGMTGFVNLWSGGSWRPIGDFPGGWAIYDMVAGPEGKPYIVTSAFVKRWDDTGWTSLGVANNGSRTALAFDPAGNLYKTHNGDVYVKDDTGWVIPQFWSSQTSPRNPILDIAFDHKGTGYFFTKSNLSVVVLQWDGLTMKKIGSLYYESSASLNCIQFDARDRLYVSGYFSRVYTADDSLMYAANLVSWDGGGWHAIGKTGRGFGDYAYINGMTADKLDNLYVAGTFEYAGGKRCRNFSIYNPGGIEETVRATVPHQAMHISRIPSIQPRGRLLVVRNGLPSDRIALFTLGGRLVVCRPTRNGLIEIPRMPRQPLVAAVIRGKRSVASRMVMSE